VCHNHDDDDDDDDDVMMVMVVNCSPGRPTGELGEKL